jgi:hypothetical protein
MPQPLPQSAYDYGTRASGEAHGVVLTRPPVVGLILDLVGYRSEHDLGAQRLLEPACGQGAFVLAAASRLLTAAQRHGRPPASLAGALLAYDIDPQQVARCQAATADLLTEKGVPPGTARELAAAWIRHADYLLTESPRADYIVGNPPYVRIEQLAPALQREYRQRYTSLHDRADLYVAFIERALAQLPPTGTLSFICANRWTRNRYGARLRQLITTNYCVRCYIDLHSASPFESAVAAYPSIWVLGPRTDAPPPPVQVVRLATASARECAAVLPLLCGQRKSAAGVEQRQYISWFAGDAPWVLTTPAQLSLLRQLEARWPTLEQAGARVGIGVATGNDRVYIVDKDAPVERDRLVPLCLRDDLHDGAVRFGGRYVLNTFDAAGAPVQRAPYPRLFAYLDAHQAELRRRHIARRSPAVWFRTIDRVYPELARAPKLLVPDIADANAFTYEPGALHPHHNLYFVTAPPWDLEALGGLLSSQVALLFLRSYAVQMRGGYLRLQAQYLRRIRVPAPTALAPPLIAALRDAFRRRDFHRLDELALTAYDLRSLPEQPGAALRR